MRVKLYDGGGGVVVVNELILALYEYDVWYGGTDDWHKSWWRDLRGGFLLRFEKRKTKKNCWSRMHYIHLMGGLTYYLRFSVTLTSLRNVSTSKKSLSHLNHQDNCRLTEDSLISSPCRRERLIQERAPSISEICSFFRNALTFRNGNHSLSMRILLWQPMLGYTFVELTHILHSL